MSGPLSIRRGCGSRAGCPRTDRGQSLERLEVQVHELVLEVGTVRGRFAVEGLVKVMVRVVVLEKVMEDLLLKLRT